MLRQHQEDERRAQRLRQFVPIRKGGCPKKVMEGNEAVMKATCTYWDKNFPRLLADAAKTVRKA